MRLVFSLVLSKSPVKTDSNGRRMREIDLEHYVSQRDDRPDEKAQDHNIVNGFREKFVEMGWRDAAPDDGYERSTVFEAWVTFVGTHMARKRTCWRVDYHRSDGCPLEVAGEGMRLVSEIKKWLKPFSSGRARRMRDIQ